MATCSLLEMLDAAIMTPRVRVVDSVVLHELLKALIIGQQGQQELSVLEPGQSPTLGLGKGKVTKEKPGQEEKERDICKKRASLQDLWEEINKFKEAQCGLAEDMRAMQKAHSGMAEDMRAMQKAHSGMAEDMRAMQKAHSGMAEDMREMQVAMQKAHSGMAQDMQEMKDAHSGLAEDIQEIQETLGLRGSFSSQATIPGDAQEPAKPWHCSGSTVTSNYELEMQELLSQLGQLGHLCTGLKEQVEQLKSSKAERADLEDVHRLFPKGGQQSITSILANLKCQVSFLQGMARTLHGEEEKISKVEDAPRKTRGSGAGRKAGGSGQMTQQPRPKGQRDEPRATVQSGEHEQAGCHVCSPDTRVLLGKLLQRCEKLEEQVESLAQKVGGKVESHPKWRRQSLQQDEQLKCLQASIVQLQKDYEKLSSAHANLQQDRQQEQNDIKALERLKSQKADKEELQLLGIDEKADKAALADKVSRSQLEACVERLNKMMEEVTSRVTGQEKSWHQFQQELQRQMDCKLDRRELGAFRQQQEEQWKSLSGQLQEKALQPERDDAAGIKKTAAMATRGLLEMLDAAIGTPRVGVVDLVVLHELLKAIIIGQQGQQELSVLEPGQSPTLGLGKGKVTKEKPGQEEKERDICKKRASLQELWEEINKFKEAQCGLAEDMRAMQKAHSGMAEDMREMQEAMQKAHSGMAQDMQEMKDAHSGLAEDIQEIQETLGLRGSFSSQATIPGDAQEPAKPWHCSGSTITSSYELEMQELLSQVGQLGHLCTGVKDQVKQLKSAKAERADLEDVRGLFPKGGQQSITSILSYLKCQMSFLQDMARTLHGEEEKAKRAPAPVSLARPKGQKDEPWATVQIGGHEQAGCHVCSPDTMVLLGKLLQRCEKLEEEVESLAQKAGRKVESHPMWRRQSLQQDEQLKRLQASIVQLQKDYGQLSSALANLQHDRQQEQNDIKALSQALGRLNKQKADKEELQLLGIDEKADKAALADKVSRSQFEACVERLNEMMEEVTSRVTGQEKGWQRFQQELQRQMDCKLDRRELGAFRQQQEERWKSLRGQLQEKALQPERDDAAGIRKQLLPGFHCLSCDRPVTMLAPGPERTGECKYPTVPQSCGGPHTVRPPRFQPQPPSTPRPPLSRARCPNKVIVPILTNKKNHQGWPQVVSQDIVRHVHNLKSTVFTVVGQVDGKTLLPLPAGSEGIEDVDLENEKSMERIDKSLVYAMESAIIDWSHQIQEALKKESSEPLLQGSDPNPKVELEFWKNRYPEQPGQCMVPCGAHFG
ncbi:hypothetical protein Q9233_017169 [Columba guinea]|nr:hypothetical protein Q9233_017169 [Columba guinea]